MPGLALIHVSKSGTRFYWFCQLNFRARTIKQKFKWTPCYTSSATLCERHGQCRHMASQITSLTSVYSTVYSVADQRKHQSSTSLVFVRGIHRWPVISPHKGPVTRKMFPFDDVIMIFNKKFPSISSMTLNIIYILFIPPGTPCTYKVYLRYDMDKLQRKMPFERRSRNGARHIHLLVKLSFAVLCMDLQILIEYSRHYLRLR